MNWPKIFMMTKPKEWFARNGMILWVIAFGCMFYGLLSLDVPHSWHDVFVRGALFAAYTFLMVGCVAWCGYFERKGRDEGRDRALSKQGEGS